jgi:hypothetical protein
VDNGTGPGVVVVVVGVDVVGVVAVVDAVVFWETLQATKNNRADPIKKAGKNCISAIFMWRCIYRKDPKISMFRLNFVSCAR